MSGPLLMYGISVSASYGKPFLESERDEGNDQGRADEMVVEVVAEQTESGQGGG
jgi:hypothetical protein